MTSTSIFDLKRPSLIILLDAVGTLSFCLTLAFGLWKLFFTPAVIINPSILNISSPAAPLQYLWVWLLAGLVLGLFVNFKNPHTKQTVMTTTGLTLVNLLALFINRHANMEYNVLLPVITLYAISTTYLISVLLPIKKNLAGFLNPAFRQKLPWLIFLAATCSYTIFLLLQHLSFGTNASDLGVYDQEAFLLSHGLPAILTIHYSDIHAFAVHFEPILYLLAPLYWLWPSAIWLLILQVIGVTIGVLAIFKIATFLKLPTSVPTCLSVAYLASAAIQNGLRFDFHSAMLMTGLLLWLFYFALARKYTQFLIAAVIFLLIKEDAGLYLIFFGLYIAIKNRDLEWAAVTSALGLIWVTTAVKFIIPGYNDGKILNLIFDKLGTNLSQVIKNLVLHPLNSIAIFFNPTEIKVPVIITTLLHGALLWAWAPWELLLLIPMFGVRFFSSRIDIWTFSMYYAAPTISVVIASALVGAAKIKAQPITISWPWSITSHQIIRGMAIFAACFSVLFGIFGVAPFHFSYPILRSAITPSYYANLNLINSKEIYAALATIPAAAPVCASQAILPHLTARQYVATFRNCDQRYTYFAFNTKVNNWPSGPEELSNFIANKLQSSTAKVLYSQGATVTFTTAPHNTAPSRPLSPTIKQWLKDNTTSAADH